jgi:hypothetical protein
MNTKTIAIVVGVIVVLGAGYYFYSTSPTYSNSGTAGTNPLYQASHTSPPSNTSSSAQVTATGNFTGTMAALASRGGAYKCTFDASTAQAQSKGTVYVSGGKSRSDFQTVAEGIPVDSYMIQMDGYVYTWTSLTPGGFKMKVAVPVAGTSVTAGSAQYANMSHSYNYDCQGWQSDVSLFQLPPNVTFTDVSK